MLKKNHWADFIYSFIIYAEESQYWIECIYFIKHYFIIQHNNSYINHTQLSSLMWQVLWMVVWFWPHFRHLKYPQISQVTAVSVGLTSKMRPHLGHNLYISLCSSMYFLTFSSAAFSKRCSPKINSMSNMLIISLQSLSAHKIVPVLVFT